MIETLSANRANYAFGVCILEVSLRRGDHLFNLHPLHSQSKFCPVNLISIPEQIARRRVFWESFDELSGRPFSRRMRCNIEVDDLTSVMQQDYEAIQVAEGQCRNGEKVDGRNLLCMIGEKCLPSLRRRRATSDSILRHGRFRKVETEKAKFCLNARDAPQRILSRHFPDQLTILLVDLRTADRSLRLPSPIELEALPVPFDHGLRFDDDQDLPPILPDLRENHPEESISPMQLRPVNFPVEDGQLLTQREILRRDRCPG